MATRITYLDIETQRTFDEVGGRQNLRELGLAVAVTCDGLSGLYQSYTESTVHDLVAELRESDLVVGFNLKAFDYPVLQHYTRFPLRTLHTLDIMEVIHVWLGFRLSLNALARATLGAEKSGDGLQAVQLFREGRLAEVIAYCQQDVALVKQLFEHGAEHGHISYIELRSGRRKDIPVRWRELL